MCVSIWCRYCTPSQFHHYLEIEMMFVLTECWKCYLLGFLFFVFIQDRFIGFFNCFSPFLQRYFFVLCIFYFRLLFSACYYIFFFILPLFAYPLYIRSAVNFMENIYTVSMDEGTSIGVYYIDKQATIMFMHQYVPAAAAAPASATCSCLLLMFLCNRLNVTNIALFFLFLRRQLPIFINMKA